MIIEIYNLGNAIKENFTDIPFAHLFGSSMYGEVKPGSDVDIAIWYNGPDPLMKVKVLSILEPFLPNIPIDIINSNNADPILAFQILSGKLLFVREEQKENQSHLN